MSSQPCLSIDSGCRLFEGYNIYPSAFARKILIHEYHNIGVRIREVFVPSKHVFQQLSYNPPANLKMLNSVSYTIPGISGIRVNIDIILPDNSVWLIGSVISREYSVDYYAMEIEKNERRLRKLEAKSDSLTGRLRMTLSDNIEILKKSNPLEVFRSWEMYYLPVDGSLDSFSELTGALKKFWRKCGVNQLCQVRLDWLKTEDVGAAEKIIGNIENIARAMAETDGDE